MSKIFGVQFAAHDEAGGLHQFAPGDDVPEWLAPVVGDHCLIVPPVGGGVVVPDDSTPDSDLDGPEDSDEGDGDEAAVVVDAAVPDFTKPARTRAKR